MPAAPPSAAEALRPLLTGEAGRQLVRYVCAGLGVMLLANLVYLVAAMPFHIAPLVANSISYVFGVGIGYAIHSRWSFRADDGNDGAMIVRFLMASGAAFALNSFWVWLATHAMHLPAWAPVPAMMLVTPLGSFALNRYWVFAA